MMKPALKHAWLAVALAASLTGLTGCASQEAASPFPHTVRPDDARNLAIADAAAGDDSKITLPGVSVVRSQAELTAVGGDASKLTVDFQTQMIVVLSLGTQHAPGYWARISEVYASSGVVWVTGIANRPSADLGGAPKSVPYAAVVVEKADGVVVSDITSAAGLGAPVSRTGAKAAAPAAPAPAAKPPATKAPAAKAAAPAPAPAAKPAPAAPKPEAPVAPTPPAAKEAAPSSTTPPAKAEEPMK